MIGTALNVESPEGISFSSELASLTDRGLAYGIDLLIRIAVVAVVGLLFAILLGPAILAGIGLWLVIYFAVEWGFYVLFESIWDGQSPGKRLFNMRVVKSAGHPIGFYDSVLRNLLRAADQLPLTYATGALAMLITHRFQRLGDLAADTVVIREHKAWYGRRPPPGADPRALAGVLRSVALSNRERRLLQEFVMRKDRLHPERREQLAEILAGPYSRRLGLPQRSSATDFIVELHLAASRGER
jgi:uncharacterized RDD family membrane protein YckC